MHGWIMQRIKVPSHISKNNMYEFMLFGKMYRHQVIVKDNVNWTVLKIKL